MGTINLYRHGDQMIKNYSDFEIPKDVKLEPAQVLFQGEAHQHKFISGEALMGELEGKRYLRIKKTATLDHEEHGKGTLPVGDYYVETKSEFDHFSEESRQVID